jgi:glutamate formiminotransferase
MSKLVQCVPNFSEGRRPEVYQAIAAAVAARAVEGVRLIDMAPDPDHNRTVITFVGPPAAASAAAFDTCAIATRLIDMEKHQGDHPRIGATDVVPFIPVRGLEMSECVTLARDLGRRIAGELGVPVYLYEEAALRPERRSLPEIRKGQYEGLKLTVATDPTRAPDYSPALSGDPESPVPLLAALPPGPLRLHPTAGATVVGARWPLIAYNVNLNTPDLSVARDIARTIRESSGGLPCLRAIGVFLAERNQAQVSMNLTNFRVTPIHTAFEAVRREAEKRGVDVAGSEIIGLVPAEALALAAAHFLKVEGFGPAQMLESHL